jgi:hypothetical protein
VNQNILVLGKAYGFDYWNETLDVAQLCTRKKLICHFAIDGADITRSTIKDIVQQIDQLGHIIIIEPSTSQFASQLTASALLSAVSSSARQLQGAIGKTPVYVRFDRSGLSNGQFLLLLQNNFIPILVDEHTKFIYNTPSRFSVSYFSVRLDACSKENQSVVSLTDCTGLAPYAL